MRSWHFQQVKKIIRSERKQLVRDQYLHAGKRNTFLSEHTPCRPHYPFVSSSPLAFLPGKILYCWPVSYQYFSVSVRVYFRLKNFKAPSGFQSLHFLCLSCNKELWLTHWLSQKLSYVETGRVRTQLLLFPWMKPQVSSAPARDGRWDSIFLCATDRRII